MTNGYISTARLPQIPVRIQDGGGNWQMLAVVVDTGFTGQLALPESYADTGFTGQLALPESYANRLGLELNDEISVTPATGRAIVVPAGNVRIIWRGEQRLARVAQAGMHPLLGMSLLWNHHIAIDAVANGAVSITPLQSQ